MWDETRTLSLMHGETSDILWHGPYECTEAYTHTHRETFFQLQAVCVHKCTLTVGKPPPDTHTGRHVPKKLWDTNSTRSGKDVPQRGERMKATKGRRTGELRGKEKIRCNKGRKGWDRSRKRRETGGFIPSLLEQSVGGIFHFMAERHCESSNKNLFLPNPENTPSDSGHFPDSVGTVCQCWEGLDQTDAAVCPWVIFSFPYKSFISESTLFWPEVDSVWGPFTAPQI